MVRSAWSSASRAQGLRDCLGLALAQAERDRLPAVLAPGRRPARAAARRATGPRRPPRIPPSAALTCSGPGRQRQQPGAAVQVLPRARRGEPPHQPLRDRVSHDRQVPDRAVLEQGQHGLGVGRRPWPRWPTRAGAACGCRGHPRRAPARPATIGRASRAGSRFAEQASWLRTSTSGSIAARRASAAATAGETLRRIAEQSRRPEPDVRVGMVERLQGRRLVQPADQVQGPERLERESGRSLLAIRRLQLRRDRRRPCDRRSAAGPSGGSTCWDRPGA